MLSNFRRWFATEPTITKGGWPFEEELEEFSVGGLPGNHEKIEDTWNSVIQVSKECCNSLIVSSFSFCCYSIETTGVHEGLADVEGTEETDEDEGFSEDVMLCNLDLHEFMLNNANPFDSSSGPWWSQFLKVTVLEWITCVS